MRCAKCKLPVERDSDGKLIMPCDEKCKAPVLAELKAAVTSKGGVR